MLKDHRIIEVEPLLSPTAVEGIFNQSNYESFSENEVAFIFLYIKSRYNQYLFGTNYYMHYTIE